jgi:hypothetical protein
MDRDNEKDSCCGETASRDENPKRMHLTAPRVAISDATSHTPAMTISRYQFQEA